MSNKGKILAIDYGTKKIGLAISDDARLLAFGRGVVDRSAGGGGFEKLIGRLEELCQKEGVVEFIIGIPLDDEGEEGEGAKRVRNFAAKLEAHFPLVKIGFVDESFSTFEGQRLQRDAGSHGADDEFAAIVILQRHLEKSAFPKSE